MPWGESAATHYDTMHTADYSPLVVHFTREKKMDMEYLLKEDDPLYSFKTSTAKDRLISILKKKTIYPSPLRYVPNNPTAVCFSECIWDGLMKLADDYSSYGVVFSKRLIFGKGGGPALYMRGDTVKRLTGNIPPSIGPFIAPFDPDEVLTPGVPVEGLHEREWRLPSPLAFEYEDLEHVLVESISDAMSVVKQIGHEQLSEEKLIPIGVYQNIRDTWGHDSHG